MTGLLGGYLAEGILNCLKSAKRSETGVKSAR